MTRGVGSCCIDLSSGAETAGETKALTEAGMCLSKSWLI